MTPLIEQPLYLAILYAAMAVVFAPDLIRTIRRRNAASGADHDQYSIRVIGFATAGSIIVAVASVYALPSFAISWHPRVVFIIGIACMLVGGFVRQYAVVTLDEYFTARVKVHDDQHVVDTGPYRWVRHPSYTGGILEYIGVGVVLANWMSVLVVAFAVCGAYGYRIHVEERTLREELGQPYRTYVDRTPYRLVPYLW